jgi:hypothetical protein
MGPEDITFIAKELGSISQVITLILRFIIVLNLPHKMVLENI